MPNERTDKPGNIFGAPLEDDDPAESAAWLYEAGRTDEAVRALIQGGLKDSSPRKIKRPKEERAKSSTT